MPIFKKEDKKLDVIVKTCLKYPKYMKLIKGNYEFAIRKFRLLNDEYIDIEGNMSEIKFIFINKGEIAFITDQNKIHLLSECPVCTIDDNVVKYLTCGHGICKDCCSVLVKSGKDICPICRRKMGRTKNEISVKKNNIINIFEKKEKKKK